ncbi:hypothetical protein K9B33_21060 [Sphingobium sp. 3R8]|uniref:hypothetical protein n=1 Tax=Sphingobium sp. 3R8 TaxID=2874921 RepID=UPI001CCF448F|nr:hypothetical protein [Sphingobium sp. 3R8]
MKVIGPAMGGADLPFEIFVGANPSVFRGSNGPLAGHLGLRNVEQIARFASEGWFMTFEGRLLFLKGLMKSARNDDTRYLIAGALRDLGYIDFQDFCRTAAAAP